jgi:phosphoserine phosphatase
VHWCRATDSGGGAALDKIAAMTSNVTAVSYGLKLSPSEPENLRSLLTDSGATFEAASSSSDGRFEVCSLDFSVPSGSAADIAGLRHAIAAAKENAERTGVDTAIVPAELRKAERKLLIMDVGSSPPTLVSGTK